MWGTIPSFVGRGETLSATERVELGHLERQLDEYYSPDWRVGYNPPRVARIATALPEGVILDVGAADGQIAAHLTTEKRLVVGMEKSSKWLEKHGRLTVPFVIADVYSIPFAKGSFDGVVLGEVLEHLYDPVSALAEVVRVLTSGGVLTGTVPNFYFLTKRLRYLVGDFGEAGDPLTHGHIRFFSRATLGNLLVGAGLSEVRIEGILNKAPGVFPFRNVWQRAQDLVANLMPELAAVTFFFRARKP